MNKPLTHVIVCDAGQWAKGTTEAEARKAFREIHSKRRVSQVWAVTANTTINEFGRFVMPRAERCTPALLS